MTRKLTRARSSNTRGADTKKPPIAGRLQQQRGRRGRHRR